jgi:hypothetical protein
MCSREKVVKIRSLNCCGFKTFFKPKIIIFMTGDLNFKTLMTLRMPEEGKSGSGLKKLRLSCDIQFL